MLSLFVMKDMRNETYHKKKGKDSVEKLGTEPGIDPQYQQTDTPYRLAT